MRHLRTTYDSIQPDEGATSIGEHEPVFILRAQDAMAPATLRYWAEAVRNAGGQAELADAVDRWAAEMEAWQRQHGCKTPDAPLDALRL
jgi:hypothetical protein